MLVSMDVSWNNALQKELNEPYFIELAKFVDSERTTKTIYPPEDKVFNALTLTPLDKVKCVIIGQDPYHQPNQAMGLSFSVPEKVAIPRSLQNIYKELQNEYNYYIPNNGDLTPWAKQGVLLLNTSLTVQQSNPASHSGKGWETFTDAVIKVVESQNRPIVYMLWGAHAKAKQNLIQKTNPRLVLTAAHPSPFSADRGFFGCNHFKRCNEYFMTLGQAPINWQIYDI